MLSKSVTHAHIHIYLDGFINNMDMIKISHVMTIYTNKHIDMFLCMCITSFLTYTTLYRSRETIVMKYVRYVLQAK